MSTDIDPRGDPRGDEAADTAEARPTGVVLLIWIFWFWAGAVLLLLGGLAVGEGPVMVAGRAMDRGEALRLVLPALVPMGLAVVGAALALALRRSWARPAALFPFVLAAFGPALIGIGAVSVVDVVVTVLALVPILAGLVWYLYFQPGPRAYFNPHAE